MDEWHTSLQKKFHNYSFIYLSFEEQQYSFKPFNVYFLFAPIYFLVQLELFGDINFLAFSSFGESHEDFFHAKVNGFTAYLNQTRSGIQLVLRIYYPIAYVSFMIFTTGTKYFIMSWYLKMNVLRKRKKSSLLEHWLTKLRAQSICILYDLAKLEPNTCPSCLAIWNI